MNMLYADPLKKLIVVFEPFGLGSFPYHTSFLCTLSCIDLSFMASGLSSLGKAIQTKGDVRAAAVITASLLVLCVAAHVKGGN